MKMPAYDQNYARKMLKNIDEITQFNELLFTHDEVVTEFVKVECTGCGETHLSPQVILNPYGYGTEGAVLLGQHHTCSKCGLDSKIIEPIYQLLSKVKKYDLYDNLETVV
ncbi:hypothetical protein [Desulfuribacillus alkaliarsenatis]|uniref:Uncharacterized protein n=1 Tax=Desulfuribacillus alkaliarsenatis TaxID=766136 RepID=A0A1E5G5Q4_9FIRM|nr:hypothetical protein [Desulfuribacillus alkaliarsenatis]OEF98507.1 hypothetical protein BHF68_02205 [Desulfuribacillus alkaliarsenatis]